MAEARSKCLALVTGHFPPSNLAGVHRARLWAQHLPEFGWEPIVVTAHWRHYEEPLDWDLHELVPRNLRVIRTGALPTRPIRLVGDIGIRAFLPLYRALADLARRHEIDFVHITIPSNYCAVLGRLMRHRFGVPYGIDYQDPWVHRSPRLERPMSKAWTSQRLARWLEPWAVRDASLITAVAPGYIRDLLTRDVALRRRAVVATTPVGGSASDFQTVGRLAKNPWLFKNECGVFRFVYAGTMWPAGLPVLERFLEALAQWAVEEPNVVHRTRVHFIGTGRGPQDTHGQYVRPLIERYGLQNWVREHARRVGYVDVLTHLQQAGAVLVLGSTDLHYTPSKVAQAVQSGRPMLAILREESEAVQMLREANAGVLVPFAEGELPSVETIVDALRTILTGGGPGPGDIRWDAFASHSARESARILAQALDRAIAEHRS